MVIELECKECHQWKPQDAFSADVTMLSGYRNQCRACRAAYLRKNRVSRRAAGKQERSESGVTIAKRDSIARSLCGVVQTYWHIPVSGQLVGWRIA